MRFGSSALQLLVLTAAASTTSAFYTNAFTTTSSSIARPPSSASHVVVVSNARQQQLHQPRTLSLLYSSETSDEGDDISPSDVETEEDVEAEASVDNTDDADDISPSDVEGEEESVETVEPTTTTATDSNSNSNDNTDMQKKNENLMFLQTLGAISGRGEFATKQQKNAAEQAMIELESMYNPTPAPTFSNNILGQWTLVYSSTQLFRSSPFFMAGRAVCKTESERQQYDFFCDMHRKALAISQIGVVRQIISTSKLVSEFEVQVGAIPFLSDFTPFKYSGGMPLVIEGAIVSSADITSTPTGKGYELYMDTVEIKGSNIPVLRQLLDNENVKLESRKLADILESNIQEYKTPRAIFETTYLDDKFRISRDQDGNAFMYVKTSTDTSVTDYSNKDADLGIARLLEGFNDSITKFYL